MTQATKHHDAELELVACDKHKDKQLELYCYECDENICVLCFAVKHTQHETAEIQ